MVKGEIKGYAIGLDGNRYALRIGEGCCCSDCCFQCRPSSCSEKRQHVFDAIICQEVALKYFKVNVNTIVNYCYELYSNKPSNLESWKKLGGK